MVAIRFLHTLLKLVPSLVAYMFGKERAENKQNKKAADNANKVNRARNRYAGDGGFRKRVQRFFNKNK